MSDTDMAPQDRPAPLLDSWLVRAVQQVLAQKAGDDDEQGARFNSAL